jgi:hypothetical protein
MLFSTPLLYRLASAFENLNAEPTLMARNADTADPLYLDTRDLQCLNQQPTPDGSTDPPLVIPTAVDLRFSDPHPSRS